MEEAIRQFLDQKNVLDLKSKHFVQQKPLIAIKLNCEKETINFSYYISIMAL